MQPNICYAVDQPHPLGLAASAAFSLAVAMILLAILGILFADGRRKVFWSGFVLFGCAYLVAVIGPSPLNLREHLPTQKLLENAAPPPWLTTATERQLLRQLDRSVTIDVTEEPLENIVKILSESIGGQFVLNKPSLEEEGVTAGTPMTLRAEQIPAKSAIKLLLDQYNLTYLVEDDVVQITSKITAGGVADFQSWQIQQTCHGLLTILIAAAGGWVASVSFARERLNFPRFSLRLFMCLPLIAASVFALARWIGIGPASVISLAVLLATIGAFQFVQKLRAISGMRSG
jgi:hypothetical protein